MQAKALFLLRVCLALPKMGLETMRTWFFTLYWKMFGRLFYSRNHFQKRSHLTVRAFEPGRGTTSSVKPSVVLNDALDSDSETMNPLWPCYC